jgi:hypothetical protein
MNWGAEREARPVGRQHGDKHRNLGQVTMLQTSRNPHFSATTWILQRTTHGCAHIAGKEYDVVLYRRYIFQASSYPYYTEEIRDQLGTRIVWRSRMPLLAICSNKQCSYNADLREEGKSGVHSLSVRRPLCRSRVILCCPVCYSPLHEKPDLRQPRCGRCKAPLRAELRRAERKIWNSSCRLNKP